MKDSKSCSRCKGSTSLAAKREFSESPCFNFVNVDCVNWRPPSGRRVHISGGFAHSSHVLNFHSDLGFWYCSACGCFAAQQLCRLGQECCHSVAGRSSQRRNSVQLCLALPFPAVCEAVPFGKKKRVPSSCRHQHRSVASQQCMKDSR